MWTYLTQADLGEAGVHPCDTDDLIDVIRTARDVGRGGASSSSSGTADSR